ncbi:MAG: hypothetical protein U0X76_04300 [Bacteroidia bacterium]
MLILLRKYFLPILIITLILRIEHNLVFSNLTIDKAIQLAATYSFKHGDGILLPAAYVSNNLKAEFIPFSGWPPGYTFCLMPAYLITSDLLLAQQLTDGIFIILLFILILRLFRKLLPINYKEAFAIFCLLNAFGFSPFHYFSSTDLIAVTFFIWSILKCHELIEAPSTRNAVMAGILLFMSALVRFSYLPLAFLIPLTIAALSFKKPGKHLFRKSLIFFSVSGMLSIALYVFEKTYYGTGTYLEKAKHAINPGELLTMDPFLWRSFFFTDTFENKFAEGSAPALLVRLAEVALTIFLLFLFFRRVYQAFKKAESASAYLNVWGISFLTTIGMLGFLTVISPPQSFTGNDHWTYFSETRYFAPVIILMQVFLIHFLFRNTENSAGLRRSIAGLFALSVIVAFGYNSFKHYKLLVQNDRQGTYEYDQKQHLDPARWLLKTNTSSKRVLVAAPNRTTMTVAAVAGGIPVMSYDSLLNHATAIDPSLPILIQFDRPLTDKQKEFISKNNVTFSFSSGEKDWYQKNLQ